MADSSTTDTTKEQGSGLPAPNAKAGGNGPAGMPRVQNTIYWK